MQYPAVTVVSIDIHIDICQYPLMSIKVHPYLLVSTNIYQYPLICIYIYYLLKSVTIYQYIYIYLYTCIDICQYLPISILIYLSTSNNIHEYILNTYVMFLSKAFPSKLPHRLVAGQRHSICGLRVYGGTHSECQLTWRQFKTNAYCMLPGTPSNIRVLSPWSHIHVQGGCSSCNAIRKVLGSLQKNKPHGKTIRHSPFRFDLVYSWVM